MTPIPMRKSQNNSIHSILFIHSIPFILYFVAFYRAQKNERMNRFSGKIRSGKCGFILRPNPALKIHNLASKKNHSILYTVRYQEWIPNLLKTQRFRL